MSVTEKNLKPFIQKNELFEVKEHPAHYRLYHILLSNEALNQFLEANKDILVQKLEYVPYMRLIIASSLKNILGEKFTSSIKAILQDRNSGGFTVGIQNQTTNPDDYVKFATAISNVMGEVNFDAMSGKYYARFTVGHTDNSDSYLRQAYRLFTLHTDGTFVDQDTDWLLMMKFAEENAVGGESRLLHLDDWEELDKFANHPLANHRFEYKAPASKNAQEPVYNQTFFERNGKPCMCFIDQFVYPETIEQATYLKELSDSMENSEHTINMPLPIGDLVMVNNTFWAHGRAAFERNTNLHRELLRQRGNFRKV